MKNWSRFTKKQGGIIALIVLLTSFNNLNAENKELKRWFIEDRRSAPYAQIEGELHPLFDSLEPLNIPTSLMMDKLKEGVSKRIPPERLIGALWGEGERLKLAQELLPIETNIYILGKEEKIILLKGLSLFLLNGLSRGQLELFIENDLPRLERILPLGGLLLDINLFSPLSEGEVKSLGLELLKSQFPPSSYKALSSLFLKGNSRRIPPAQMVSLITSVLKKGGGLVQINGELNRRLRK